MFHGRPFDADPAHRDLATLISLTDRAAVASTCGRFEETGQLGHIPEDGDDHK
jgi:hypothetical protein